MSNSKIIPTKRYSDLKELLNDAVSMYGTQDAYRYKVKKEIVS